MHIDIFLMLGKFSTEKMTLNKEKKKAQEAKKKKSINENINNAEILQEKTIDIAKTEYRRKGNR